MALKITNMDQVQAQLDAWCAKAEKRATDVARGLAVKAFENIVTRGPQYSGDFVANIRVSVNNVDTTFQEHVVSGSLPKTHGLSGSFQEGALPAIRYARFNASQGIANFKLGDTIYISSSAQRRGDNYAFKIERNTIKFRDVNPSGGETFSKSRARVLNTYGAMSPGNINTLANARWY